MSSLSERLKRVDEASQHARTESNKLIESVLSINNAQQAYSQRQKQLSDLELEITQLRSANREVKVALMQALIERDELQTKRLALKTLNERLSNHNDNLQRETDDLLRGDEVNVLCEDFSFKDQLTLMKELQDTRYRLIKCGFPLSFFA